MEFSIKANKNKESRPIIHMHGYLEWRKVPGIELKAYFSPFFKFPEEVEMLPLIDQMKLAPVRFLMIKTNHLPNVEEFTELTDQLPNWWTDIVNAIEWNTNVWSLNESKFLQRLVNVNTLYFKFTQLSASQFRSLLEETKKIHCREISGGYDTDHVLVDDSTLEFLIQQSMIHAITRLRIIAVNISVSVQNMIRFLEEVVLNPNKTYNELSDKEEEDYDVSIEMNIVKMNGSKEDWTCWIDKNCKKRNEKSYNEFIYEDRLCKIFIRKFYDC